MKLFQKIITLLIVLFINTSVLSQVKTKQYFKKGSFALQFQFDENFKFKDFQGSVISFKYHTSEKSSIRLGISSSYYDSKTDKKSIQKPADYKAPHDNQISFNINSQFIKYLSFDIMKYYFGIGPTFGMSRDEYVERRVYNDEDIRYVRIIDTLSNFGCIVVLGAEYFINSKICISVEFQSLASYIYNREDDELTGRAITKSINISPLNAKIGFAFYI